MEILIKLQNCQNNRFGMETLHNLFKNIGKISKTVHSQPNIDFSLGFAGTKRFPPLTRRPPYVIYSATL